ncbi:uncharacterized protein LOC116337987 [Contarinia nasturtii]|uniref:uncharacterized protein LOC116337987 n=1 Tax=Contarinia nasturtii TaxID=265458 RepID=UPI0012D4C442|nr:uncharacterized protein LOC116337987 [Contarinia nasturtii]
METKETNEIPTNDDIAAARREARRRKILENSKSRLSRITGREDTDEDDKKTDKETETQPKEQVIYPDPEVERDVYVPQTTPPFPPELFGAVDGMGSIDDRQQFFELFNTLQQQNSGQANSNTFAAFAQFGNMGGGEAGPNAFFGNLNTNEQPKVPETPLQKFLNTKIHIGLLAVLTYLFILLTPFHWNVFLVFLLWEIAEIFILRQHESNSNGIINVLFMLAGISPAKVNIVLKWVQLLNKVLRDVALFMFFFVLTHVCRVYWTGLSLVPLIERSDQSQRIPDIIDGNADDEFEHFEL